MLEEILKSINSNLERIANALETENVDAVADIVHESAKQFKQVETTQVVPQQTAQALPQQTAQVVIPQAPVAEIPQTIPTAQMQENFTLDQLAVAMSNAVSTGKMPIIQGILQQFGVQALTQISPNDYNKLATMLKEKGVEV